LSIGASNISVISDHARRPPFSLDPLIAEAKRRARQRRLLLAIALAAVLAVTIVAFGLETGTPAAPVTRSSARVFEYGVYEYNLTAEETEALRAMFSARAASQLDGADKIAARLEFSEVGWIQTWMLDGKTWSFDKAGLFQRDYFGDFQVNGDRLVLHGQDIDTTLSYKWSLDADVLSLKLTEDSEDAASRELVFATQQHAFTRVDD
jgi:hypothetical protein